MYGDLTVRGDIAGPLRPSDRRQAFAKRLDGLKLIRKDQLTAPVYETKFPFLRAPNH
jgi:hypothetical protein